MQSEVYDLIIIGGGLAGLSCAVHLSQKRLKILLIERHSFPHHRVCGEYVSVEVLPYLKNLGVDPMAQGAVSITDLQLTTPGGKTTKHKLPLGGFGLSRYKLDNLIFKRAGETTTMLTDTATSIDPMEDHYEVATKSGKIFRSLFVAAAYGKRSLLDKNMDRKFISKRTGWMAVKAHYHYDHPENLVSLHNFEGGYCGVSRVEDEIVNACCLTTVNSFGKSKSIEDFQRTTMSKNPYLKEFFQSAQPRFDTPLTISQISFEKKSAVENGIFMLGDSAGLIHPLCGNGMAMALHSANIFSNLFLEYFKGTQTNRELLEQLYRKQWHSTFSGRLKTAGWIQKILMNNLASNVALEIAGIVPALVPVVIRKTHGSVFV